MPVVFVIFFGLSWLDLLNFLLLLLELHLGDSDCIVDFLFVNVRDDFFLLHLSFLESFRPSVPLSTPWQITFWNGGRSNRAVDSTWRV